MRLWVDEGHGGSDSGAVGGGKVEDTRNLSLGEAIERVAGWQGWVVNSSRETDVAVTLQQRYQRANAWKADLFVSIHHDWNKGEQAVIFANTHDVTASKRLATYINSKIVTVANSFPEGGVYADRRGLAVLRGTNMPAVIVEAARVQDNYSVGLMAEAIVKGICAFKGVPFKTQAPAHPSTQTRVGVMNRDVHVSATRTGAPSGTVAHKGGVVNIELYDRGYARISWGGGYRGWVPSDSVTPK